MRARKNDQTYVRTISAIERLRNSVNGNPQYSLTFTDGTSAKTQPDALVAYGLENSTYRDTPVEFTATPSGLIWNAQPVDAADTDQVALWIANDDQYLPDARRQLERGVGTLQDYLEAILAEPREGSAPWQVRMALGKAGLERVAWSVVAEAITQA